MILQLLKKVSGSTSCIEENDSFTYNKDFTTTYSSIRMKPVFLNIQIDYQITEERKVNGEATTMINLSKEFVNTYVHTGRKLPLGGREDMNVAVQLKEVPETVKQFPKGGIGSSERGQVTIPAHNTLKAAGPCPSYLKK